MGNHIDAQQPAHTCGCCEVDDCPACNADKARIMSQVGSSSRRIQVDDEPFITPDYVISDEALTAAQSISEQFEVPTTHEDVLEALGIVEQDSSDNNGGSTDYYRINDSWSMAQDVIEDRVMNYSQGNIFKVAFCFNQGRHDATSYERELNKIIYFAQRELDRIKGN